MAAARRARVLQLRRGRRRHAATAVPAARPRRRGGPGAGRCRGRSGAAARSRLVRTAGADDLVGGRGQSLTFARPADLAARTSCCRDEETIDVTARRRDMTDWPDEWFRE